MKLPEKFWIVIHSDAHSKLVQDKLFSLGYKWTISGRSYSLSTVGLNPDYEYGTISFYINSIEKKIQYSNKAHYSTRSEYGNQISTDDLLSIEDFKQQTVRLNDKHEAVVSSDGTIKVGCQTFSHNIIKDLAEAIKEVNQ